MKYEDLLFLASYQDQIRMEEARWKLLARGVSNRLAERRVAFNHFNALELDDMSDNHRFNVLEKHK